MKEGKKILDACCGSRMMWFDKGNPSVLFVDNRTVNDTLCDGRKLIINPDKKEDFTSLSFKDNEFSMVVFDPPHLIKLGKNSWMAKKYGVLNYSWKDDIRQGLNECIRVVKVGGTVIFKWNEHQVRLVDVLKVIDHKPLFGHTSGKNGKTIWMAFLKINSEPKDKVIATQRSCSKNRSLV